MDKYLKNIITVTVFTLFNNVVYAQSIMDVLDLLANKPVIEWLDEPLIETFVKSEKSHYISKFKIENLPKNTSAIVASVYIQPPVYEFNNETKTFVSENDACHDELFLERKSQFNDHIVVVIGRDLELFYSNIIEPYKNGNIENGVNWHAAYNNKQTHTWFKNSGTHTGDVVITSSSCYGQHIPTTIIPVTQSHTIDVLVNWGKNSSIADSFLGLQIYGVYVSRELSELFSSDQ